MAIKTGTKLKVNEPHVVHETIDGEAILLNLSTGNYYSIEWPGTFVWNLLCETGNVKGIIDAFTNTNGSKKEDIEKSVSSFVDSIIKEELMISIENEDAIPVQLNDQTEESLKKTVQQLDGLALNKYSDMQDMLLLDPIHDVDEKGWPEPKKDN